MGSGAWGNIPQWITAIVATLALIVATSGVLVQWLMARKRAAIDFFLKTEADAHMVAAYDKFWAGIRAMRSMDVTVFCTSEDEEIRKHYFSVRQYLNIHELVAVGIKNGMFDKNTCYDFWAAVLLRSVEEARPVIDLIRARAGRELTYDDMLKVYQEWKDREKRAAR